MNLINAALVQNRSILSNWVDSTPVPQVIDTMTYDLYEANNPFRKTFNKDEISNRALRAAANTTTAAGADLFSFFANPYYLTHKAAQIPAAYKNAADMYKKYSQNK